MDKLVISAKDVNFAHSCGASVDLIDRMKEKSREFYFFIADQGGECACLFDRSKKDGEGQELVAFLGTISFFFKSIWSANSGRLADVPDMNFTERIEKCGGEEFQLSELSRFIDFKQSIEFLSELLDRMIELQAFTCSRIYLIMRIVMEELDKQRCASK